MMISLNKEFCWLSLLAESFLSCESSLHCYQSVLWAGIPWLAQGHGFCLLLLNASIKWIQNSKIHLSICIVNLKDFLGVIISQSFVFIAAVKISMTVLIQLS